MRILNEKRVFTLKVELTMDEIDGLLHFIGPTSQNDRTKPPYFLQENENVALSAIYDVLSKWKKGVSGE